MIGDDRLCWVDDGNDTIEWKGLVALQVEYRRQRLRQRPTRTVGAEGGRIRNRRRIRSTAAGAERRHACDHQGTTHHPLKLDQVLPKPGKVLSKILLRSRLLPAVCQLVVRGKEFPRRRELQSGTRNPEKGQLVLDRSPDFVVTGQFFGINVQRYENFSFGSERTSGDWIHIIGDRISRG